MSIPPTLALHENPGEIISRVAIPAQHARIFGVPPEGEHPVEEPWCFGVGSSLFCCRYKLAPCLVGPGVFLAGEYTKGSDKVPTAIVVVKLLSKERLAAYAQRGEAEVRPWTAPVCCLFEARPPSVCSRTVTHCAIAWACIL
jgi:hypothetical protein